MVWAILNYLSVLLVWLLVGVMAVRFALQEYRAALVHRRVISLKALQQRSLELERKCGLVFDDCGKLQVLWPGYWEYSQTGNKIRPEGCAHNYWIEPAETVGVGAHEHYRSLVIAKQRAEQEWDDRLVSNTNRQQPNRCVHELVVSPDGYVFCAYCGTNLGHQQDNALSCYHVGGLHTTGGTGLCF